MTGPGRGYGQILREFGIGPKKKLGQHFMIDPGLLRTVAALMLPEGSSWVALEIGAGIGTLTRELCARAEWVYAVELDRDLEGARAWMTGHLPNLTWIWGDALVAPDLTGRDLREKHPGSCLALVGNLPYYITSEILYRALIPRTPWSRLAFVVQEEVGERMAGRPGSRDFGRLSLWCQYRAEISLEKRLPPGCFVPRPEVGSCVVTLLMKDSFPLSEEEEEFLDSVSRSVFSKRRKTLANGLAGIIPDKERVSKAMEEAGIDPSLRPEDLGVDGFVALTKALLPLAREL
ncbi:MAG TPA: ribosomal RNA small subunit methyltransferase A [Firmicutes bacterium]|nr:ribosomal RNA small subunit methyltransferase A [Candidatus Fermentithermobacillaceae bacterium]